MADAAPSHPFLVDTADLPPTAPEVPDRAWQAWLLLLLILTLSGASMSVRLSSGGARSWHESVTLRTAHETWLRQHGGAGAWIVPSIDGTPRAAKPPMAAWLAMLSWSDLPARTSDATLLVARARGAALTLALLTLVFVYALGAALFDRRLGLIAAAIAGSLPFFQQFARMLTPDLGLLAGATLAVASAATCLSPVRPEPTTARRWLGWGGCALGIAFGWMSKGPICVLIVVLGVAPLVALGTRRRGAAVASLLASVVVAALCVLPWYLQLGRVSSDLTATLLREYRGPDWDHRPAWYYVGHFGWTLPWSAWFASGVALPFALARGSARRARLPGIAMFIAILLVFSAVSQKLPRYILPIVPAFALIAAQPWRDLLVFGRGETASRVAPLVFVPHWLACGVASAGFAVVFGFSASLREAGVATPSIVERIPPALGFSVWTLLTAIAAAGWWLQRTRRTAPAFICAFLWALGTAAIWWTVHGEAGGFELRSTGP